MVVNHRCSRLMRLVGALVPLLTLLLGVGAAQPAAAAPVGTFYTLPTMSYTPFLCTEGCEIGGSLIGLSYAGDGECAGCLPPSPIRAGAFSFDLSVDRFWPTDPVRPKSGVGALAVIWSDGSTTSATYAFKARDSKALSLTGKVTGGTNSLFTVGTDFGGLVGLPPSPIEPAVTSAAVSFG